MKCSSSLKSSFYSFAGLAPVSPCFCCTGEPINLDVSHQRWAQGKSPADNTLPNAAQGAVGSLCCKVTSLACVQMIAHHDTQVLLCRSAFQPAGLYLVLVSQVVLHQVQHFALYFIELHEVSFCLSLQTVDVPLNGKKPIWHINCMNLDEEVGSSQFCSVSWWPL